jgi:hypothetical protein
MKTLRYGLMLLVFFCPTQVWAKTASDYFPICTAPGGAGGKILIVDPSSRTAGSLASVDVALKNARPGDTVSLMNGDYGDLIVKGQAGSGQTPRITKLTINASHWRFTGLTISGHSLQGALVNISDSDNIIFDKNVVASKIGNLSWGPQLMDKNTADVISNGIFANQSSCVSVTDNHINNVFNGLMAGGDQTSNRGQYLLISGNVIDNFAGDGIDHQASHIRIENNHITNGHNICNNQCVHNDGIQGWNWNNRPGVVNTDVVITGNEIVVQADPNLVLPADAFQGITIFDGSWDGVQITNNVVIASAWHGITIMRAHNVSIINNTVAPANPKRSTWITYSPSKDQPQMAPNSVVIRNNAAREVGIYKNEKLGNVAAVDHNLSIKSADSFADVFAKFDLEHFAFDLHPARRSDARGEGSSEGAPANDIEGNPRKAPIDIGAYSYSGK